MKLLLLNPAYPFEELPTPPFGLISLAAYLLERGVQVRIEDYIVTPYSRKRVEKILSEYAPDVVGATAVTMNVNTALTLLKEYKEENPDIFTIMGGPHVTFDAQSILDKNDQVDCIVRGEGEITTVELLESINSLSSLSRVQGISYRTNGRIFHNQDRTLIDDINILPFPARHLVPLNRYKALTFPLNMTTARGCPYNCIFCAGRKMMGRKVRYFDVKRVVDEFEMLSKMGFRQINVVDDLFTSNEKRCIAICDEIIERGISHPWNAFARVNTVSKRLLEKMKQAGCTTLCFGVESGNQEILNTIKKKITTEQVTKAVRLCNEVGMDSIGSYILGLPGESPETVKESFAFASGLNHSYGFHILSPFPGTEIRERHEEYGIKILTDDWDKYDANHAVSETSYLSHKEIDRIVNTFNADIEETISLIEKDREENKQLSKKYMDHFESRDNLLFSKELITSELVEEYPGLDGGAGVGETIDDFVTFIETHTNFTRDSIQRRLDRLFSLGCLKVEKSKNGMDVKWAEFNSPCA
ncbi:MAG: radical SAM protein [Thermodesulfobacteriota bacterium]|nr:radical SAM protein [Thermodesulfobacteriota bacterium]